jgi:hypothetical protein
MRGCVPHHQGQNSTLIAAPPCRREQDAQGDGRTPNLAPRARLRFRLLGGVREALISLAFESARTSPDRFDVCKLSLSTGSHAGQIPALGRGSCSAALADANRTATVDAVTPGRAAPDGAVSVGRALRLHLACYRSELFRRRRIARSGIGRAQNDVSRRGSRHRPDGGREARRGNEQQADPHQMKSHPSLPHRSPPCAVVFADPPVCRIPHPVGG